MVNPDGGERDTDSQIPSSFLRPPFGQDETVDARLPTPAAIGRYQIRGELGRGATSVVYLARDPKLEREVALKLLREADDVDTTTSQRFRREARIVAMLEHAGIVRVFDYGIAAGRRFIVMQHMEGGTLQDFIDVKRLQSEGLSVESCTPAYQRECAQIVAMLSDALGYAHSKGVVHRDLKPTNILLDRSGHPRLADFGLAKRPADADLTRSGEMAGTIPYMSPEQVNRSLEVGQRSDIYSLGTILYELLALRRAFDGSNFVETCHLIQTAKYLPLRRQNQGIARELQTVAERCMEVDPDHRYQSCAHVAADLQSFIEGAAILARPVPRRRRIVQWVRWHPRVATSICVAILFVCLVVSLVITQRVARKSQGLLAVRNAPRGVVITVAEMDPESLGYSKPFRCGKEEYLRPGQYRLAVAGEGVALECDAVIEAGQQEIIVRLPSVFARPGQLSEMVFVPAGDYEVGSFSGGTFDGPQVVSSSGFFIDKYEVSNADYRGFLVATKRPQPEHWKEFDFETDLADHPVVGLTPDEMRDFALWAGKRLATAIEWEIAARFPDGRLHPWVGPTPEELPVLTVEDFLLERSAEGASLFELYRRLSQPVRSGSEHASHLGIHNLFGNVAEATSTALTSRGLMLFVKGGSWLDTPASWDLARTSSIPYGRGSMKTGFRCVRSRKPR